MTSRTTKRRAWIGVVLAVAVVSLLMTSLVGVAVSQEERATPHFDEGVDYWLTVLHNNDGESAVLTDGVEGGVDQFLLVRDRAERQAKKKPYGYRAPRGVIMVSSGDNFLASPSLEATFADGMFYDAMALNKLNYDAIILGNHDFDFGPDFLEDFIEMGFPAHRPPTYLSANLDFSMEPGLQDLVDDGIISGSTVVVERGKEIGIVGATTENLPIISSPRDVIVTDVATAAQAEIDALTAAGVDIIVFVSHLQGVGEDIALAAALTDVDIMIAGGGDELLANPDDLLLPSDDPADIFGAYPLFAVGADGADIPVVTTSGSYGYLGHLVVGFDEDGNVVEIDDDRTGPHRVVDKSVGSDGVGTERYMADKVQKPVNRFVKNLAKDIVGVSEVGLDGTRLPGVRSMETNEGNLIADSQMWQAQELAGDFGVNPADVAIQNGGGIRNDDIIPAGDISVADTFDMVPFGNQVVVFEDLPPATFLGLMENAVSVIPADGDPSGLDGTGRFAQIAGFTMVYDSSQPAGSKVVTITLDDATPIVAGGAVMPGAPDLNVAVNSFVAGGGDGYDWGGATFTSLGVSYQQALANFIEDPAGLGGLISAADYPEGGEGRIVNISPALP